MSAMDELAKLRAFKALTHRLLDAMGAPQFEDAACRVGERMAWVADELARLEQDSLKASGSESTPAGGTAGRKQNDPAPAGSTNDSQVEPLAPGDDDFIKGRGAGSRVRVTFTLPDCGWGTMEIDPLPRGGETIHFGGGNSAEVHRVEHSLEHGPLLVLHREQYALEHFPLADITQIDWQPYPGLNS